MTPSHALPNHFSRRSDYPWHNGHRGERNEKNATVTGAYHEFGQIGRAALHGDPEEFATRLIFAPSTGRQNALMMSRQPPPTL
jgi:hypothetical protein